MQARFVTFSALALILAAAAPAAAQGLTLAEALTLGACPELPVCGSCSADDEAATAEDVQAPQPEPTATAHGGAEAHQDVFVTEVAAQPQAHFVGSANGGVWKTATAQGPADDGVVVLDQSLPQGGAAGTGTLTLTNGAQALTPELPVCAVCNVGGAPATPSDVTPPPAEGRTDYYIALGGVEGEASAPAPTGHDVQAPQQPQAGLLIPAVQPPRRDGSIADRPQMDGVVVLNQEQEQAGKTGTGTLTLSSGGQAVTPEMPICANCGADTPAQAQPQPEQQERPRRNFSITIGGVTVGTGGVNVAVGDVNGDGREARRGSSAPASRTRGE
jgi:hypothetical protein